MTQLKEDLGQISEDDHGVKTFKRELLAEIEKRMGSFEEEEQYSLACSLDPRYTVYKHNIFILKSALKRFDFNIF